MFIKYNNLYAKTRDGNQVKLKGTKYGVMFEVTIPGASTAITTPYENLKVFPGERESNYDIVEVLSKNKYPELYL